MATYQRGRVASRCYSRPEVRNETSGHYYRLDCWFRRHPDRLLHLGRSRSKTCRPNRPLTTRGDNSVAAVLWWVKPAKWMSLNKFSRRHASKLSSYCLLRARVCADEDLCRVSARRWSVIHGIDEMQPYKETLPTLCTCYVRLLHGMCNAGVGMPAT